MKDSRDFHFRIQQGFVFFPPDHRSQSRTITAHSVVRLVPGLGSSGIKAAAFLPAGLKKLLELKGPEVGGWAPFQRMAINLGTAMNAAVVGVFLVHGAPAGRSHELGACCDDPPAGDAGPPAVLGITDGAGPGAIASPGLSIHERSGDTAN